MKRRSFLRRASVFPLPFLLSRSPLSALSAPWLAEEMEDNGRILVLLQLRGGNDGLNTIIPLDQYEGLTSARPELVIPANKVLSLEDNLGIHPAMAGVHQLYQEGKVSVVQGVGYPEQNRSHFRSTDIMNTASDSDEVLTTGWLGRHLDARTPTFPEGYPNSEEPDPFAIVMGSALAETCQGRAGNYSTVLAGLGSIGQLPVYEGGPTLDTNYGRELSWLRDTIAKNNEYATSIERAGELGMNAVDYPAGNQLAQKLKDVAKLISGGSRTRIYVAELGGFDTHAGQAAGGDTTIGEHADLLLTLSNAIAAFQADLAAQGLEERVVGMTYSEFGRRIVGNGSNGTDHGDAAPMLLFGSCVQPGVTGENANVPVDVDIRLGVEMQYDFRDVYGSLLMDWFGVPEASARQLLSTDFQHLPLFGACNATSIQDPGNNAANALSLNVYPNPVSEQLTVGFRSGGGRVSVAVYNAAGSLVLPITDRSFTAGDQRITVPVARLPRGAYLVRVMEAGGVQASRRFVKE
ncbi:DUF1501 domain-containing protein [Lewinella sp. 4G2]|uniref:DUF1501 domain-containing protein n=1 Tax=Lewinella sp. 4G2 TaxID=1803372 RepID=UPI0007B49AD0|nr:DUF1501 domain-containing protein [Lewinella sp. 4G2]OAV46292.1 hypothetical protein A3850_018735 [Lewinella sp. 4G2]